MKHIDIDIDHIELDITNPRIQQALEMYKSDSITADQISLALQEGDGDTSSLGKLKESIRTCGKIINPIVVSQHDEKYRCIEGNTRVQIYRDFASTGVSGNWSKIPSLVIENPEDRDVDAIRLQAHLVGPRQWTPYAKARYIYELWNVNHLTHREIVQYCGGNKREVMRQIAAFKQFERDYKTHFSNCDIKNFSAFVEYQQPKIGYTIVSSGYDSMEFCKWIDQRRFSRLEHVRRLPEILGNDQAREAFVSKNSSEAIKVLNQPSLEQIIEQLSLADTLDILTNKIILLSEDEKDELKKNPKDICPRLNSAFREIEGLLAELKK